MTCLSCAPIRSLRRIAVVLCFVNLAAACESDRTTTSLDSRDGSLIPSTSVINNPPIGGSTTVGVGDTLKLQAAVATRRGRNFHWVSSNSSIARVNAQGVAVASGIGSVVLFAVSSARTDRWNVDVEKAVATIFVSPDSIVAMPGTST